MKRTLLAGTMLAVAAPSALTQAAAPAPAPPADWTLAGSVDAAYVSATGNSEVTTVSIGDKLAASRGNWTLRQMVAYVYGKTDGTESANQLRAGLRAEYRITNRFSGFTAVNYERNPYAGFSRRVDELFGAQWRALATSGDSVTLDAGAVYTQQANTDGTSSASPSARAAMGYKHLFGGKSHFSQNVEYVPNLTESGEYRMNAESALVAPLSGRISLRLGYLVQYNSRPPTTFGTTDRIFTSGLQVAF